MYFTPFLLPRVTFPILPDAVCIIKFVSYLGLELPPATTFP